MTSITSGPETEAALKRPAAKKPATRKRVLALSTVGIVSFSLTLLAGSIAVLTGLFPLRAMAFAERVEVGTMLFVAPVLALVLAVVFEVTRIALTRPDLPQPRRREAVIWTPGRRDS